MSLESLIIALLLALSAALLIYVWRLRREQELLAPARPARSSHSKQENSSALFETALHAIDVGVAIVDDEQRVRFCNQRCLEMLGRQLHEVLGRSTIVLLRDHNAEALVREALARRETRTDVLRPVFGQQTVDLRCLPLEQGGALLVLRDMTRLSRLERARRDLIANVSHDLRTPLTSLRLLVETLQSDPPPGLVERMLGQMQGEIDDLVRLVDKLNELARIESGKLILQLRPLAPAALIHRAIERMRPQAAERNLLLTSSADADLPQILVDWDQMEQALLNLLQNAVKFTPPGGTVSVAACLAEHPDDSANGEPWVDIAVSDTGQGIPAEDLPRIFERFYKVDRARTRGAGGLGLGLAIVKHLVEGHGGRLRAESELGQGSRFHILLPPAPR